MAKALGIGGVFFKCRDRTALGAWYRRYLDLPVNERGGVEFDLGSIPPGAYCVWGPFEEKTHYFNPSLKEFMINLIVDDLDGALSQVEEGGATLVGGVEEYDYGRFGWFIDPEGNKVELWEPAP
ncbi:MAG TPA: VOC family protein [Longimicrobiales bacterium]|nr:VOC family protein [Longimicrobiales bacterium]